MGAELVNIGNDWIFLSSGTAEAYFLPLGDFISCFFYHQWGVCGGENVDSVLERSSEQKNKLLRKFLRITFRRPKGGLLFMLNWFV